MKTTFTSPADFWKVRDFGTKISATFEFLQGHWRPLGKALVYFVTPASLLMGIGMGLFTNPVYNQMGKQMASQHGGSAAADTSAAAFDMSTLWGIGLGAVGFAIAFLLLLSTVYGYLRARLRLPATEPVTPAVVWQEIKGKMGQMLLVILLLVVTYLVIVAAFTLFMALFARGGGVAGIGGFILGFFLLLFLGVYLSTVFTLYFPALWLEDQSVFGAVGRSFSLIKGNWWSTFGLMMVVGFIQGALSVVFVVPFYATMAGKMFQIPMLGSDIAGLTGTTFYSIGIIFTYAISLLTAAFQYFSLVEQREGRGLHLLVGELGQPQVAPVAYSHHYRPDEEGEY